MLTVEEERSGKTSPILGGFRMLRPGVVQNAPSKESTQTVGGNTSALNLRPGCGGLRAGKEEVSIEIKSREGGIKGRCLLG